MDLIVLIIQMITRALAAPKPGAPARKNEDEIVRQIQARIEAAQQSGSRSPTQPRQLSRQSPRMVKKLPPLFQKKMARRKAPPALPGAPVARAVVSKIAAVPVPPQSPAPSIRTADARLLSRWLRPQTLRAQFILTEVFQPPVALRESHLI